ncbi:fatty-acid oxidation protein subunit alpha [Scytonema hofmannii PCC 7110]|uniref:Fatty-acid oxidation protein subunit alpha n=1 Tax=Scytonema hofmannii PCC 7110 TaxID=128403 RepID=A0A139WV34_9CYAN|nr:XisI protein [Scytonema hofmannii]KYC36306.1 fatty-acid oxidation protein subunit alpha [Scytonema hofmannii PCC 7110]
MEKLNYSDVVENILKQYATITVGEGTEVELVADRSNGHYLVMFIGWRDEVQVYGSLIHIDIKGNQIWIQQDGTNEGIAQQLVEVGVPQSDIVLGYRSPLVRPFTGFGVGIKSQSEAKPLEGVGSSVG